MSIIIKFDDFFEVFVIFFFKLRFFLTLCQFFEKKPRIVSCAPSRPKKTDIISIFYQRPLNGLFSCSGILLANLIKKENSALFPFFYDRRI